MIARDEEESLPRLIEQVMPLVDSAVVVDTGSVDDTPRIAADAGATVHHRPWRNFAHNRTEALQLAQGTADYHLMLDADHRIEVGGELPPELTADSYLLRISSAGDEWRLPLLTRDGHPFEYRGAAHAYLASPAPTRSENLDWLIIHGGPGASVEKLERDRLLLMESFLENPNDPRTVFYLAESCRFLGRVEEAIRFYRLRANMDGFDEERYWSRYQLGMLIGAHIEGLAGCEELIAAWRERPHRAEALRALANIADAVADKLPLPNDKLFVRTSAYRQ